MYLLCKLNRLMCWLIITDFIIKLIRLGRLLFFFFTYDHDAVIFSFPMQRHVSSARYTPNITFRKSQELFHHPVLMVDGHKWGQLTYDPIRPSIMQKHVPWASNIISRKSQELSHCSLLMVNTHKWGQLTYDPVPTFHLSALHVYQYPASHIYLYPCYSYSIFHVYQASTFCIYPAFRICPYSGILIIQARLSISLPLTFHTDLPFCL